MSLLSRHLEQIALSADSIATLPFPPPKIFTNALLSTPDITSLIRDTEPHERALFSTIFNVASGEVTTSSSSTSRVPRRNTAVAAVLGAELHSEVRKTERGRGEVDVEVLLRGVEKLNAVYAVKGVEGRVRDVRARYGRLRGSVEFFERKVERLTREVEGIRRRDGWVESDEEEEGGDGGEESVHVTEEDLRREEEEIRELEGRKRDLEERVSGMERDLGGLLR
ncbi:hypothetical protein HYFRA_00008669 [Hymenoscyphus fraxineus]|uniref:DASH complex subunit SPC34 n=1 Tax=Hymenoscyphus fraxineus TaxID=746836 RepID=A0A9N9PTA1_9HELO|nr:hypothetical protein HYFRA_00008669 [Hymenoscyphus fraxineus]